MMTVRRGVITFGVSLAFAASAFAQKITMEFDDTVAFGKFKTFAIRSGELRSPGAALNSELTKKRLAAAAEEPMTYGAALAVVLVVAAEPVIAQTAAPQRFENATAGISIVRPAGWQTASLQAVQENRERVQLSDPEMQAALQKAATAPLFVFMKHPEPYPAINPTIQVTLRPVGALASSPPRQMLETALALLEKAFADFVLVTDITDVHVSGLAGAHARAKYTGKRTDGTEFKVLARLWVVPRGAFTILIGMSGPQEGPDLSESEFEEVLASISIQK